MVVFLNHHFPKMKSRSAFGLKYRLCSVMSSKSVEFTYSILPSEFEKIDYFCTLNLVLR